MGIVVIIGLISVLGFETDHITTTKQCLKAIGVIWVLSSLVYVGVGSYNLWMSDQPQLIDWASVSWGLSGVIPLIVKSIYTSSTLHNTV